MHAIANKLDEFSNFTYTISSRALTDNEVILAEMISWKHQLQADGRHYRPVLTEYLPEDVALQG